MRMYLSPDCSIQQNEHNFMITKHKKAENVCTSTYQQDTSDEPLCIIS